MLVCGASTILKIRNIAVMVAALFSVSACVTAVPDMADVQKSSGATERASAAKTSELAKIEVASVVANNPDLAPKRKVSNKSSRPYNAIIAKHAAANGVPLRLAHAVVFSESSYNANARGAVGEIGLMQLRLPTARLMGYRGSAKALYDPDTNIRYGMKYLGRAHKIAGGKTCGTILRYNAGLGAKRMNPISARYCRKVARLLK